MKNFSERLSMMASNRNSRRRGWLLSSPGRPAGEVRYISEVWHCGGGQWDGAEEECLELNCWGRGMMRRRRRRREGGRRRRGWVGTSRMNWFSSKYRVVRRERWRASSPRCQRSERRKVSSRWSERWKVSSRWHESQKTSSSWCESWED